jgi:hypothetical protein
MWVIPEYLDPGKPNVGDILNRYKGRVLDLTQYNTLKTKDVCEALAEISYANGYRGKGGPQRAIIFPGDSRYSFWDKEKTVSVGRKGRKVKKTLHNANNYMKFADTINLTNTRMTETELKKGELTPKKLLREYLSSDENREELMEGSIRGTGWYDVKTNIHTCYPFISIAKGRRFANDCKNEGMMKFDYQGSDAYVVVYSVSRGDRREYIIEIKMLPVTGEDKTQYVEWTMTRFPVGSEDNFFKSKSSKTNLDDVGPKVFKYRTAESYVAFQAYAALLNAQERSKKYDDIDTFLVDFFEPRGYMGVWHTLSTGGIVKPDNGNMRRITEAEINAQLGKMLGFDPEFMMDLSE